MVRLAFLAGTFVLVTAASEPVPVLSVGEVIARHEALDGKVVRVRGWRVVACYSLGCEIRARNERSSPRLSIGGSAMFDRDLQARSAIGSEIVVEGRVQRDCFDHQHDAGDTAKDVIICSDRAPELANPRLIEVVSHSQRDH